MEDGGGGGDYLVSSRERLLMVMVWFGLKEVVWGVVVVKGCYCCCKGEKRSCSVLEAVDESMFSVFFFFLIMIFLTTFFLPKRSLC